MLEEILRRIREVQHFPDGPIPLHAPVFAGNEKKYVIDAIESTFVSSVGEYVTRFEEMLCSLTGARHAVACCNGTSALEMSLRLAGVRSGDVVLTQPLSFVATANAIVHAGAEPVFLDIERNTLGLSPSAVRDFLQAQCVRGQGVCRLADTGQRVAACVPMHSFGLPVRMDELLAICGEWNVPVVEDAAEALGSSYKGRYCGTMGQLGVLSFNGNKTVTTGGGGAILTNNDELATTAKHLTTTGKIPHPWEYRHDTVAWNFRLPNLNAALGCAQLEQIENFIETKRKRAAAYAEIFNGTGWEFVMEPEYCRSNYWLCAVLTNSVVEKKTFIEKANASGLGTRPAWEPLHTLPIYQNCRCGELSTTIDIASRLVNLPSGVVRNF
ncbi:LegC family aminotransferase [Nitratidesulfovibrio vulgaris]|nr:LegC family aminotransferase [Nitratidesulfovibrio vulgaris]